MVERRTDPIGKSRPSPAAELRESAPAGRDDGPGAISRRQVAVAVQYDGVDSESAPRVVASGHGAVAEQILAIAFDKGVKVREDADLAELLAAVDLDEEIPVEAFAAVAEVLAYVYRANARPRTDGDTAEAPAAPKRMRESDR